MAHDMSERERDAVAAALFQARRDVLPLRAYPGAMPATLADAYAIQRIIVGFANSPVLGWKVGRIPPALIDSLGQDRLAGAILRVDSIADDDPSPTPMPVFGEGFAAVEAEFMLRVGRLPDSGAIDNDRAAACIDEIRIGFEIASSPYAEVNAQGPFVTIADLSANHGILLGTTVPSDPDIIAAEVEMTIDDSPVGRGRVADMLDGPFGAARFVFEMAASGAITVTPGQWISSGAITGVHPIRPGSIATARFGGGNYRVDCRITAQSMPGIPSAPHAKDGSSCR